MPGKRSLKTNTSTLWNWPEAELKSLHSRVAAGRAAQLGWAPQCEPSAPAGPRPRGFHSGYRALIVKHFRGTREYPEGGPWQRSRRRPPSEKGLQIADLPRASPYNFSLCNHDEIQEDLLNGLDPHRTFKNEELQLDFHTCEDALSPPAGLQQSEGARRAERAARLLECFLERARGCGQRPSLWRSTLHIVLRHCPGYRPPQGAAAGEASRGPCDESKARELMAVWRSYINLG